MLIELKYGKTGIYEYDRVLKPKKYGSLYYAFDVKKCRKCISSLKENI